MRGFSGRVLGGLRLAVFVAIATLYPPPPSPLPPLNNRF